MNLRTHHNAETELLCDVCKNDSPYWIFPSCKECTAAYVIAVPGSMGEQPQALRTHRRVS
jgi:hypothetical protein